jgi:hypothetical protein
MLNSSEQLVYDKLRHQVELEPDAHRLYLSKKERDIYINSLDEHTLNQYRTSKRFSLRHPTFKGVRIYLEK